MAIDRLLRDSTNQQRQVLEDTPFKRSSRRIIPVAHAATRLQLPHTCSHDSDMAYDKAQRRATALFIRFAATDLLGCRTMRASTDLQAGQSHCGSCECAHWAMTSALRDDKMPRVLSDIKGDKMLTPNRERYLKNRMGLNTPEKENFTRLSTAKEKTDFVRSRISTHDLHNSFNETAYAKQLSSTLEGPSAANDFDQSIEKKFKPREDALSDDVAEGILDFKMAMSLAYRELLGILKLANLNLSMRLQQVKNYNALENKIHLIEEAYGLKKEITDTEINDYVETLKDLLALRKALLTKLPYSVSFYTLTFEQISHREDFSCLKACVSIMENLTEPADRQKGFRLHIQRIKKTAFLNEPPALAKVQTRLWEAQGQLEGWEDLGPCNVKLLDKWLFGVMDGTERKAPTEEELRLQLIDMTKKEPKPSKKLPK